MTKVEFIKSHGWKYQSNITNTRLIWLVRDCVDFTDIIRINDLLSMGWTEVYSLMGY